VHDSIPEEHEKGVQAFTESLEHKDITCSDCGFTDAILHSAWKTQIDTDPRSGHIHYHLTCPDCNETETVEINL
jgi:hypothetical protein